MRRTPGELQSCALALFQVEVSRHALTDANEVDRPAEDQRVGSGCEQRRIRRERHPRLVRAVAKAHVEQHFERHLAVDPLDDAHDVAALAHWHEVHDPNRAAVADPLALEDQRVVAVSMTVLADWYGWAQRPASVFVVAEERREAGVRVEMRRTEPVEVAKARDQRGRARVADETVVFDPGCHDAVCDLDAIRPDASCESRTGSAESVKAGLISAWSSTATDRAGSTAPATKCCS